MKVSRMTVRSTSCKGHHDHPQHLQGKGYRNCPSPLLLQEVQMSKVRQFFVAMGLVLALLMPTFGLADDAAASVGHCSVGAYGWSSGSYVHATAYFSCTSPHTGT